jgi:Ca2+-transporting ATPase
MKGAPEVVLVRCVRRLDGESQQPLTEGDRQEILRANERLASEGLRVLGVAYRSAERETRVDDLEAEMVFLGLVAMQDPPREEAREAVAACGRAGIRPVMITGDHAATALAIARQVGLAVDSDLVLTGAELGAMTDEALREVVPDVSVYARISAEQKVRIVAALQANDEVVAVTGDGINDAPALHRADIGVAMGLSGTDVAKEAADIVIADDNFATIVTAVEEGRHIFDNIRNFLVYMLGGNIGEIVVVFVGVISGLPLPLLPIQILFVNLVTDGPPALALGVEPGDAESLERPPRQRREQLVTRPLWMTVVFRGLVLGATVLAIYVLWYEGLGRSEEESRTIAFAALVVAHVLKAFTCRSLYKTVWSLGPLTNLWLVAGCAVSLGALLLVLYVPGLTDAFETKTLHLDDWLVIAAFSAVPLAIIEAAKLSPWRLRP